MIEKVDDGQYPLDTIHILNELSYTNIREVCIDGYKVYTGSKRYKIIEDYGFKCKECGDIGVFAYLILSESNPERAHFAVTTKRGNILTKDHIVAKSRGGNNKIGNLQCLCNKCNEKKGNMDCI